MKKKKIKLLMKRFEDLLFTIINSKTCSIGSIDSHYDLVLSKTVIDKLHKDIKELQNE